MYPSKRLFSLMAVAGVAAVAAGCGSSGNKASSGNAGSSSSSKAVTSTPSVPSTKAITLSVKSDTEHAKKGPDGQWHDAFLPGNFSVGAGQRVTVTVYNYDESAHSFNSPQLGVNEVIPAGSASVPHKFVFTFTAPKKSGSYQWFCAMPCDPWAMAHNGYMRGHVKVTA